MRERETFRGTDNVCLENHCYELKVPFVYKMSNGVFFRIDSVKFSYPKTLKKQLREEDVVEIKFCLRDDDNIEGTDTIEQWELVVFPMYRNGEEIRHGIIVEYTDSAVNGNLTIEKGKITKYSSNHISGLEYKQVQIPVLEFVKTYIEEFVRCVY